MEHIKKGHSSRTAYGDRMRELCQGYDGSLELIERGELSAKQIEKKRALGTYSISFQTRPASAEEAGGNEPCETDQT